MDEKKELVFCPGLYVDKPKENAPKAIKLKLAIKVDEFKTFLDTNRNQKGYVNIDLRKSEAKGTFYATLNTFIVDMKRPESIDASTMVSSSNTGERLSDGSMEPNFDQDIPF